jgi:uncharacterized protein (TIGR02246 family)
MRRISVAVAVAVAAVLAIAGVNSAGQGQSNTDPILNKMAAEWAAAYNAKDAAKVAGMYTSDAVYMPPNQPMVKGRAAIEAMFKKEFQEGFANIKLTPVESAISGSQAFEAGTATVTVPGGRTESAKYLAVFAQEGGTWKIKYDTHNADQPSPPRK